MKYYKQIIKDGKTLYDIVWGSTMEDDDTLALVKSKECKWSIIDIETGAHIANNFKTKKAALEFYNEKKENLHASIARARHYTFNEERRARLSKHRILRAGNRCTYIDVKDSVILDLIQYLPRNDTWIVEDAFHKFEVSPDSIIKVSEVD